MTELNHITATSKDIFLAKLEGLGLFFGSIDQTDYPSFIQFAIDHKLVEFYYQKEWRAIVCAVKATDKFDFAIIDATYTYRDRPVKIKKGDLIFFTEIVSANDYWCERLDVRTDQHKHHLFVDIANRVKDYKKYNFDV